MDSGRGGLQLPFSAGCNLERDARPQLVNNRQQAINGKPLQFYLADARKIRGGDAGPALCFSN